MRLKEIFRFMSFCVQTLLFTFKRILILSAGQRFLSSIYTIILIVFEAANAIICGI
jgi:hypothetical protein